MKLLKPRWIVVTAENGGQEKQYFHSYFKARKVKKEMLLDNPDSCITVVHNPFRKRHPDFPLWFSIFALLFGGMQEDVCSGIHHILQAMQIWK